MMKFWGKNFWQLATLAIEAEYNEGMIVLLTILLEAIIVKF